MGWDVDPTWHSKADVVTEQLAGLGSGYEILEYKSTSSGLWMLVKMRSSGKKGLFFDLIERHGSQFAVKSMDEGMGPSYYDCPVRFLDATPKDESFTFNAEWRKRYLETNNGKRGVSNTGPGFAGI
jgi:hypothetical protein